MQNSINQLSINTKTRKFIGRVVLYTPINKIYSYIRIDSSDNSFY